MILTVTLNPTLDKRLLLEKFNIGEMSRAKKIFITPSGKGIDVARTIKLLNGKVIATGFIAGESGNYILIEVLDASGAGDCLIAGLVYGLMKNKDIKEVLRLATACASSCCINYGTANCNLGEIMKFYKKVKVVNIQFS